MTLIYTAWRRLTDNNYTVQLKMNRGRGGSVCGVFRVFNEEETVTTHISSVTHTHLCSAFTKFLDPFSVLLKNFMHIISQSHKSTHINLYSA